jgi:hypothetical protein
MEKTPEQLAANRRRVLESHGQPVAATPAEPTYSPGNTGNGSTAPAKPDPEYAAWKAKRGW